MTDEQTVVIDITNMSLDELDYFADETGLEFEEYAMKMDSTTFKADGVPLRKFLRVMAVIANRRAGLDDSAAGDFGMTDVINMFVDSNVLDAVNEEDGGLVPPDVPLESVA